MFVVALIRRGLCLQAEEKFNATLEAARRTRIAAADKQRKDDGIMSVKLEERRRNNRKQHDKFQEQQQQLKAANRQAELKGHRKRQLSSRNWIESEFNTSTHSESNTDFV